MKRRSSCGGCPFDRDTKSYVEDGRRNLFKDDLSIDAGEHVFTSIVHRDSRRIPIHCQFNPVQQVLKTQQHQVSEIDRHFAHLEVEPIRSDETRPPIIGHGNNFQHASLIQ